MEATQSGRPGPSWLSIVLAALSLVLDAGLWAASLVVVLGSPREGEPGAVLAYALIILGPAVCVAALLLAVGSLIPRRRAGWLGMAALVVWASLPLAAAVNAVGVRETLLWIGMGAISVALAWLLVWGILWLAKRRGPRTRTAVKWGLITLGAAVALAATMIIGLLFT